MFTIIINSINGIIPTEHKQIVVAKITIRIDPSANVGVIEAGAAVVEAGCIR